MLAILAFAVYEVFWQFNPPAIFSTKLLENLKVEDTSIFYAQMAVTYALLFAGWLRLPFLQPPSRFWVGVAPLRGDQRIYSVILGSVALLVLAIIFPFLPLEEWLRITWLPRTMDYLLVGAFVLIWAFVL